MDRAALGYIQVTPARRSVAIAYLKDLKVRRRENYQTPLSRLYRLKSFFFKKGELDYMNYVLCIIHNYGKLQIMPPHMFHIAIDLFENNFKHVNLDREFYFFDPTKNPSKFHELIVWAMRYDKVRSTIYLPHAQAADIRTCVYCNTQYAINISTGDASAFYELDHNKPKSKYPYLCTSFFNLLPCCGPCNRHKSSGKKYNNVDIDDLLDLSIYSQVPGEKSPFMFRLAPNSIDDYFNNGNTNGLKVKLTSNPQDIANAYNTLFYLDTLYSGFGLEVQEILKHGKFVQNSYATMLHDSYSKSFPNTKHDALLFYWGVPMNPNEDFKKPLAKLTQDLVRQMEQCWKINLV